MEEQQIPKSVSKRLKDYYSLYWLFTICHYLFGIGGVVASAIVAAYSKDSNIVKVFGIISALCIAFIGFIKPDQQYRKYVVAWRILDEKINRFRFNLISINELIDGMVVAEKTLDQIEKDIEKQRTLSQDEEK